MQLRDIEYFAAVAEHGNLRRAAEALELSQPALSKSLRRLESALQTKLVRKIPKGIELTPAGVAYLACVRRVNLTLDDAAHEVADLTQGRAGHLRVGANPYSIDYLLPAVCSAMLKEAPMVTLKVILGTGDFLLPALRNGQFDLIICGTSALPDDDVTQVHLLADEFSVYVSANHRLARLKRVTIADLAREEWALPPDASMPRWLRRVFEDNRLPPPRITLETSATSLRLSGVASSHLLGFASRRYVREAAPQMRLVELRVKELMWRRSLGVMYRRNAYLSPVAQRFIEILKSIAKKTAKEP